MHELDVSTTDMYGMVIHFAEENMDVNGKVTDDAIHDIEYSHYDGGGERRDCGRRILNIYDAIARGEILRLCSA